MINQRNWAELQETFLAGKPFNHIVIDDFWTAEVAEQLAQDYPDYEDPVWSAHYKNPIEDKKACNHWDKFPAATYRAFNYLNSPEFVKIVETITGHPSVHTDVGLHGGGWHSHHRGGKLNVHLDYSIHPKLRLERHYNLIIYMTPDWQPEWGGGLELWASDDQGRPTELANRVTNKFNRAVIFDTTQNSWHGLPEPLECPEDTFRRSMAIYYLTDPSAKADPRVKALYAPYKEQANDPAILELIEKRAQAGLAETVYRNEN